MADHWEASLQLTSVQKLTWLSLIDHFATSELWLIGNIGAVLQIGSLKCSAVDGKYKTISSCYRRTIKIKMIRSKTRKILILRTKVSKRKVKDEKRLAIKLSPLTKMMRQQKFKLQSWLVLQEKYASEKSKEQIGRDSLVFSVNNSAENSLRQCGQSQKLKTPSIK